MKEKLELLKEWNNTKTSSIIKLSIWIIIIILIAALTKTVQPNTKNPTQIIENIEKPTSEKIKQTLKNINNYEEEIIVETEEVENIHLTKSNEDILITYNNESYYKTDVIYKIQTNEIIENKLLKDIIYYNIENIRDYLENIDEDYLTTYKDNSYKIGYTILLNNETPTFQINEATNEAKITITGNETINKIEIEFQNYEIKKITLNISNINNIENIEVEK